ncbi:cytochrome P450 [Mycena leptocephala]|nr:cytochrome P450 [Mycena leptocephala]
MFLVIALSSLTTGLLLIYWHRLTHSLPLPPGPRAFPIIGNKFDIPAETPPWITYARWGDKFSASKIVYFTIFRRKMLVLNTLAAATELLDNRGAIYSERPSSVMFGELLNRQNSVFFVPYHSPRFKAYRKILQAGLNSRAVEAYAPLQTQEARTFLKGLLKSPDNFRSLIRRNAGAVIMKLAFGYSVTSDQDKLVDLADTLIRISEEAAKPGWVVDSFPVLKYVPSWMPGAGFKRIAEKWRNQVIDLNRVPFSYVKAQIASGTAVPSFTSRLLEPATGPKPTAAEEDLIMWVAGGLYAAGTDTTSGFMSIFFLVMSHFPDMQARAQQEIDDLLGQKRLPEIHDRESLPFTNRLIKEVHRWAPIATLAIPHCVTQDDEYLGYRIPKGTTVITNRWAMMHDPALYPDPSVPTLRPGCTPNAKPSFKFDPDRFLDCPGHVAETSPELIIFGFGRRACPGIHMATISIFISVASTLASFDIRKPSNGDNMDQDLNVKFATGIVAHPGPFECAVTPRSEAAIALIEQSNE